MSGLYKTGDNVQIVFNSAIREQHRLVGGIVLSEEQPGLYRCQMPMGVAMLYTEAELSPATDAVKGDIAAMTVPNG